MHLNDTEIRRAVAEGRLKIEPPPVDIQFQPASLDMRLGRGFFQFRRPLGKPDKIEPIDPEQAIRADWGDKIDSDELVIHHGQFILGTTVERVTIPGTRSCGRSTKARPA